ncbi:MAG TPA: PD-(D/E)XK nuclease superfamily protein [Polyangiaceae bacterium]|nr:PD-(D/E)XK nuclease superfamily protein [Polyangiaceae bacterium]
MSGRGAAPSGGDALEQQVAALAERLGLEVRRQVKVGRRLWGAERRIDVVVTEPVSRRRLGLECKFQSVPGTAEEKIPTTIQDISAWPIPGIVVFSGEGFSPYMRSFLIASGRSVELEDLEAWLRLFFGLALD